MFLDLLAMQTFFPKVGTLNLLNISSTPRGVAGTNLGSPEQKRPYERENRGMGMERKKEGGKRVIQGQTSSDLCH